MRARGSIPVAVLRIEAPDGTILWEYMGDQYEADCAVAPNCTFIYDDELGYLVNNVLADQNTRARVLGQSRVSVWPPQRRFFAASMFHVSHARGSRPTSICC